MGRWRRVRLVGGIAVSTVFLGVTLSRVDLPEVARSMASASAPLLIAVVIIVLFDLALRALRWQALVRGSKAAESPSPFLLTAGYLSVGYLANSVLPARLGDVARAYLAGRAFAMPTLVAFGTIVVERLLDGTVMLALALASSFLLASNSDIRTISVVSLIGTMAGAIVVALAHRASRTQAGYTRLGLAVRRNVAKVYLGTRGLRDLRAGITILGLTVLTTTTSVFIVAIACRANGIALSPTQAVLTASGIALSLAIPAAPGSWGTYEFAGVAILTGLGFDANRALATVLLLRLVSTLPPAALGLFSVVLLNLRPASVFRAAEASLAAPRTGRREELRTTTEVVGP